VCVCVGGGGYCWAINDCEDFMTRIIFILHFICGWYTGKNIVLSQRKD